MCDSLCFVLFYSRKSSQMLQFLKKFPESEEHIPNTELHASDKIKTLEINA
jgi:hypothetical protein